MTQNIVKKTIGNVASSYQVNIAIEIPNITENYINSHVFTCRYWVSAMLIKYTSRCWEVFEWPDIFSNREGSELIGTCRENSV